MRTRLLGLLPQGGEVPEIGVLNGDISQDILTEAKPRRLHLIDPWEHRDRADYANDPSNAPEIEQNDRFSINPLPWTRAGWFARLSRL